MKRGICFAVILSFIPGCIGISEARVESLTGGMSVGYDIDHASYYFLSGTSVIEKNQMTATPSLNYKNSGIHDSFELRYSPALSYDLNGRSNSIGQNFGVSGQKSIVKNWQINISELYIKSDDSTLTSNQNTSVAQNIAESTFSQNTSTSVNATGNTSVGMNQISSALGRQRFWTNYASLMSNYTFLQDSVLSMGYTNTLLRNDGAAEALGYQGFDNHTGLLSVSYRFNPAWKIITGGQYVRGLFDRPRTASPSVQSDFFGPYGITSIESYLISTIRGLTGSQTPVRSGTQSDLTEYHGNIAIQSYISSINMLSLSYDYTGTKYDDPTRNNIDTNNVTMGWKRDISPHLNYDLGGGPSYSRTEGGSSYARTGGYTGKWGYNAHAKVNYGIEHGSFGLGISKLFSQDNFTGTSTGGYADTWEVKGNFNYQLYKDLASGVFASYQNQDHRSAVISNVSNTVSYQQKVYTAGATMNYTFWQWFTASAGYTFSREASEKHMGFDIDDHRIFVTVGAAKELLRW